MSVTKYLKLGQIAGVLLLGAGVASCQLHDATRTMPLLFLSGGLLFAGCRLTMWLRKD
jgi:hypothetical protein